MKKAKESRATGSRFMQWAKRRAHVRYDLASSGVMNYPLSMLPVRMEDLEITGDSFYGYAPLQQALSEHCGVPQEKVFATLGTSFANHMAMAALLQPGDEVLIEQPTYELILTTARYLGARIRRFPRRTEKGFQILPRDVERAVSRKTRLIVVTNLHNPSSAATPAATLKRVGEIARSVRANVLVDEVYLDAAFEQSPGSAIHLGREFIVTSSLTKVYGLSGLRCGWVLADPAVVRKMWHLKDLYENIPPHVSERLSVVALQNIERIRSRARWVLTENQKALLETFLSRNDIECAWPGSGTVVFPRLRSGAVEKLQKRLLEQFETAVAPGRFFESPEHFRIGLGGDPEVFREGLRNVCRALDDIHSRRT